VVHELTGVIVIRVHSSKRRGWSYLVVWLCSWWARPLSGQAAPIRISRHWNVDLRFRHIAVGGILLGPCATIVRRKADLQVGAMAPTRSTAVIVAGLAFNSGEGVSSRALWSSVIRQGGTIDH